MTKILIIDDTPSAYSGTEGLLLITNPGCTCTKSITYDTVWGIGYRGV